MSSGRTLVLNLTRFGDLIQTQGVIHGLREQGSAVGLVCVDAFADAARLLAGLDAVFVLPGAGLLAQMDRCWPDALRQLGRLQEAVRAFAPQRVINLTPTVSSRLLSRFLAETAGAAQDGFVVDSQGFGYATTRWADFLQAVSAHRGCSPFNLVDIMARMSGVAPPVHSRLAAPPQETPALAPWAAGRVAIQLGASHPSRRYPVASFVAAARAIYAESGRMPVLVGAGGERPLAEQFLALADFPCISLVGQTDLGQLAAVLAQCQALLTNDTGTMHLAAGLGVPVVAIFLATAQPWDTGPAQEGAICLEPDLDCHPCAFGTPCPHERACRGHLPGTEVGMAVAQWVEHGHWPASGPPGARVWRVTRDAAGFWDLESLSGHGCLWRPQWTAMVRPLYRQFLDDLPLLAQPQAMESAPARLRKGLPAAAGFLAVVAAQAEALALHGAASLGRKLMPHCQRVEDTLLAVPELAPLGVLWQLTWRSQQDLRALAGRSRRFRDMLQAMATVVGIKLE
ncbi:MAG: glycosyltransferase family 9 protein [Desulfomicrobiaceae bacterium]